LLGDWGSGVAHINKLCATLADRSN